jgi:coenzyme F420-reducing hydrogenase delta subunit/ferredoxin
MAGTTRLHYPANVRLLRFPCTGRMNPMFIVKAFERGADGVLVSGCHPGDCHYIHGNLVARRRFTVFRSLMELLGLDQRRLHFAWVSAAEAQKWVNVVREVTDAVRSAGPLPTPSDSVASTPDPFAALEGSAAVRTPPTAEDLEAVTRDLRAAAANLLEQGEVSRVVGYGSGSLPGSAVPTIVSRPEQVDDLQWSPHCYSNLSVYLSRMVESGKKIGVVVKACDVKSVVGLVQEGQVERDDVTLIGVPCGGLWDGELIADKCVTCTGEVPSLCDLPATVDIERAGAESAPTGDDPRDRELEALMALPSDQRWAWWQAQLEGCIRCYACRAVCPLCYCDTCIADHHRPQWVSKSIDGRGNTAWNVIRAFHLAGRCTGCDECARVCPADIRLDLLNRHLALEVERQYGYRSGEDMEAVPVMAEFRTEDPEEFIL